MPNDTESFKCIPVFCVRNTSASGIRYPYDQLMQNLGYLTDGQSYRFIITCLKEVSEDNVPKNYRCAYVVQHEQTRQIIAQENTTLPVTDAGKRLLIKFIHYPQKYFRSKEWDVLTFRGKQSPMSQDEVVEVVEKW